VQTDLPRIVRQERRKAMYIVEWEMNLGLLMRLIGDNLCLGLLEQEGHGHLGHRTSDGEDGQTCTSW
jgi:hypothetical protein